MAVVRNLSPPRGLGQGGQFFSKRGRLCNVTLHLIDDQLPGESLMDEIQSNHSLDCVRVEE